MEERNEKDRENEKDTDRADDDDEEGRQQRGLAAVAEPSCMLGLCLIAPRMDWRKLMRNS